MENFFHMTDCHVEKFLHMRNVKKIYHMTNELCGEMSRNLSCREMWRYLSFGVMLPQCGIHMTDFSTRAMKNVENICYFSTLAMTNVEKICHVEKFLHIRDVEKICQVEKFSSVMKKLREKHS